jgi:hypothetical protein
MVKLSQSQQILDHLRMNGSITPLVAMRKYGCLRLGARIYDLKREGHPISMSIIERNGKHYAEYKLSKVNTNAVDKQ